MKSFDAHIEFMLLTCGSDTWLYPFAAQLLDVYSSALQATVTGRLTADEMDRAAKVAREKLRTGLCDLISTAQTATGQTRTTSPPSGATQQTKPTD